MALPAVHHRWWAHGGRRPTPGWVQVGLGHIRGLSPLGGWAVVAVMLALSVALAYALGGAALVAPHWFYVPIIVAGARFGLPGALPTAVAAGLLVSPAVAAVAASGGAHSLSDWASSAIAFVVVGTLGAWLVQDAAAAAGDDLKALRLEHELLEAIDGNQLRLHYQPVVSLADGTVVGVEALVRWEHPQRGQVAAGEFIPLAERGALIVVLGAWVLAEACRQVAEWRRTVLRDVADFSVAVNVSGVQLSRAGLIDEIVRVLGETALDPSWLCLEITETALVEDLESSIEGLLGLKLLGVRVAADDFGTGYSSLAYLRRLPVDVVKIDQAFVQGMTTEDDDDAIVSAVVALAHAMNKTVVAEGVETAEQADALRALGCDQAQGYYFGRPQAAELIGPLLGAQPPPLISPPASR